MKRSLSHNMPTFSRWLSTFQWSSPRQWRISPLWQIDRRRAQQHSLLRLLRTAVVQRSPLLPLLACWAEDHRGRRHWTLARLTRRLEEGTPLADALEQTPGALSLAATLAVRFGSQSGTLAATLEAAAAEGRSPTWHAADRLHRMLVYFAGLLVIGGGVVGFILVTIMPVLQEILVDFSLEAPAALKLVISLGNLAVQFWWILLLAALVGSALFYTQRGWSYVHRVWLPRVSRSAATIQRADVLGMLAVAMRAGRPLPGAISTLARYHYNRRIRNQLLFVRNEVEQGADLWISMQQCGFCSAAEAEAIREATSSGARAWTMDQLAEVRRVRVAERLEAGLYLVHVALTLMFAAGVLLIALATLGPLATLTSGLGG